MRRSLALRMHTRALATGHRRSTALAASTEVHWCLFRALPKCVSVAAWIIRGEELWEIWKLLPCYAKSNQHQQQLQSLSWKVGYAGAPKYNLPLPLAWLADQAGPPAPSNFPSTQKTSFFFFKKKRRAGYFILALLQNKRNHKFRCPTLIVHLVWNFFMFSIFIVIRL